MINQNKPFVVVESPFSTPTIERIVLNIQYTMLAVRDSLNRGEAPYASHLFYTQMLDDNNSTERMLGIDAGLSICRYANQTAMYVDLGISKGMEYGGLSAREAGREVVERRLFPDSVSMDDIASLIRQEYGKHDLPSADTIASIYGRIIR